MKIKNLILPETSPIYFNKKNLQNPKRIAKILNINYQIVKTWNNWFYINNKWYYYKNFLQYQNSDEHFLNELIGEFLATFLGLNTINYQIGCTLNCEKEMEYGLLSENFRQKRKKYIVPTDLYLEVNCTQLNNLINLKHYCKSNEMYKKLLLQLLKMITLDIYMNQQDRTKNNFLFEKEKNGIILAPLYDYEKSLTITSSTTDSPQYSSCIFGIDMSNYNELVKYPELQNLLQIITTLDINDILDIISNKYKIKIPILQRKKYTEITEKRKKLIRKYLKN